MQRETDSHDRGGGVEPHWRKCAGCGRQFRVDTHLQAQQPHYCPICDYRRTRRRLEQLNHSHGAESEADGESE